MTVRMTRRSYWWYKRCWRPIELALSWIIRGGHHTRLAPCDSFLINGTPWLCLCCLRVRRRIAGVSLGGRDETVLVCNGDVYVWPGRATGFYIE